MDGIALKYLGLDGWVIVVVLALIVAVGFPTIIIRKMSKYKREAVHGIYAKMWTRTNKAYYVMCRTIGDFAVVEESERGKLPVFATQKRKFKYVISPAQCGSMLYPMGRPRFMQVMASTGEWNENDPEQIVVKKGGVVQDTAALVDAATNENFAQTLVGSVEQFSRDLKTMTKTQVPVVVYVVMGLMCVGIVAIIFMLRSQGAQ